ncbi:MAG TPA: hypothetical protein P5247_02830 [Candidatus Saccharimonadales bacterium]|nr:hypothetical protein [Candidatus Saccharimonadales bacterium]
MAEQLSSKPMIDTTVAIYPRGIEANPGPNGINPSHPPDVIESMSYDLGRLTIGMCKTTPREVNLGSSSYSELEIARLLDNTSASITQQTEMEEERLLLGMQTGSLDPDRSWAATAALDDGIDPDFRDRYFSNEKEIEFLRGLGPRSLNPDQSNRLKSLEREQKRIINHHSTNDKFRTFRGFARRRRDVDARRGGVLGGATETELAATFEGKGQHGKILHGRRSKEVRTHLKAEKEQTRNIVARKGFMLTLSDPSHPRGKRNYIVDDVASTPAQAFKIIGLDTKGEPIFEKDASGKEVLHDMYLPEIDPKTKRPMIDPSTHKVVLKKTQVPVIDPATGLPKISNTGQIVMREVPIPVPRDGTYGISGMDKTSGKAANSGPFYYQDGSPVHTKAWGPDSFKPTDDRAILKPLLSGEEAVEVLVKGHNSGYGLSDKHITVGLLCGYIENNPDSIVDKKTREKVIQNHLVFRETNDITDQSLLPPFDFNEKTGHFERFYYVDPVTTRTRKILEHQQIYGGERVKEGRKKGLRARADRLSS